MLPHPTREHCVTKARAPAQETNSNLKGKGIRTRARAQGEKSPKSLNTSNAMLSTLSLSCVEKKASLDIRIKHLNEITKRIILPYHRFCGIGLSNQHR